jgi:hypothetical protein
MGEAWYLRDWYDRLSQADKGVVHRLLASWLQSTDEEKLHVALWFLEWVEPVVELGPLVRQLVGHIDATLHERSSGDRLYLGFVGAVAKLRLDEVIPYLKRWADSISGRSHYWSWTGLRAAIALLQLDREAALEYAPRVARAVVEFPPEPIHVNTVLNQFICAYLVFYPDAMRELGRAFSSAAATHKPLIETASRQEIAQLVSSRLRTEEWAAEARRQFADGLTGQPAS